MNPTREVFENIPHHNWLYILATIGVISLIYGITRRIILWRKGKNINRTDRISTRIINTIKQIFIAPKQYYRSYRAIFHLLIFWGFAILFIGTVLVFSHEYFGFETMHGSFYLAMSFALDLFGILLIIGCILALFRRYILLPEGLDRKPEDLFTPILLILVVLSGFLVEGARISIAQPSFERWSFGGWAIASLFTGLSDTTRLILHRYLWWVHISLASLFIGLIPYLKLSHFLYAPLSIFTSSLEPKGHLPMIEDIEEQEVFGAPTIKDLTYKDLIDADACVRCGRCQEVCPAYNSGKPLSPKKFIQDLKLEMNTLSRVRKNNNGLEEIVGHTIQADELWACTTCFACQEFCPIFIEHIPKIVELRRSEVLNVSRFPEELNLTFKNLETNYNPWGIGFADRDKWTEGLDIKRFEKPGDAEYLLFVGCMGSYDDRAIKAMRALVSILKKAGIDFAILGTEELCCGDSARRLGNEYLYQILTMENIEKFNERNITKIITACPHGYNTLKNEYSKFGFKGEIYHHTQIITEAIKDGNINIGHKNSPTIVYHDSCYLGRYNNIYNEPREIIKRATGSNPFEPKNTRRSSFCCGAGGGRMWMEETIGSRINEVRFDELMGCGTDVIAVSCPFCLTMLNDGKKAKAPDSDIEIMDIAEIVERAIS